MYNESQIKKFYMTAYTNIFIASWTVTALWIYVDGYMNKIIHNDE